MSETSLNSLPNFNLDTVEDMPGFETPPSGRYACSLSTVMKEINGKPYISFDYTLIEQLAKGTQNLGNPAMPGQKFNTLVGYNEKGLAYAKPVLMKLRTALGLGGGVQDIVDSVKDLAVEVTFNYRGYTNNKGEAAESFNLVSLDIK